MLIVELSISGWATTYWWLCRGEMARWAHI